MNELVFVEMTGPGLQALEYAAQVGHRTTVLRSPRYDFFMSDEQRARARALAHRTVTVDDLHDLPAVLDALRTAGVERDRIGTVVTTLHMCIVQAARLATELGVPGPSLETMTAARDKARCREVLDAEGIPNVGHGVAHEVTGALEVAGRIGYPVIIKPSNGTGKVHTTMAHSAQDVEAHFAAVEASGDRFAPGVVAELDGRFVIEEVAVGPLYSVEIAGDGRNVTPLVTVRRKTGRDNPVLELGSTVPSGLSAEEDREVGEYAVRICRALGLVVGVFHVEVMRTQDGPRLIEVNPRIAGGAIPDLVKAATGCSLYEVFVDVHAGKKAPKEPFPQIAGASHSFITAAQDCTVRDDLPEDWFEAFRPRIHSGTSSIRPGAQLRRMDGNLDVYGVVRVIAEDFQAAERACVEIIDDVEKTVGVPLVHPAAGTGR